MEKSRQSYLENARDAAASAAADLCLSLRVKTAGVVLAMRDAERAARVDASGRTTRRAHCESTALLSITPAAAVLAARYAQCDARRSLAANADGSTTQRNASAISIVPFRSSSTPSSP